MMADMQRIKEDLPGIDCGSCGAPNCRALAEDIVKGECSIDACVIRKIRLSEQNKDCGDAKEE